MGAMKAKSNVPVTPGLLKWAREEAGLTLKEAAVRARIKELKPRGESSGVEPWQRLKRWETGADPLSFRQLEKIAKAYRRPVLTFFLPAPPSGDSTLTDFRTVGDKVSSFKDSPEFAALVRRIRALHKHIKEIVDQEGPKIVKFVGTGNIDYDELVAANSIREHLSFSFREQQQTRDSGQLFRNLRAKAERIGIFIVMEGDLGSYHSAISPDIFRGIVISDTSAPLIVVNPKDSVAARVITLAHELVHLWLGDTGVSNVNSLGTKNQSIIYRERYCNKVAAEFLVPAHELRTRWEGLPDTDNLPTSIHTSAKYFKVSDICLARRLLDLHFISNDYYWEYYRGYIKWLQAIKEKREESNGGPEPVTQNKFRLGNRLISTVLDAAQAGWISELDASQLLRVKINKFSDIYPEIAQ